LKRRESISASGLFSVLYFQEEGKIIRKEAGKKGRLQEGVRRIYLRDVKHLTIWRTRGEHFRLQSSVKEGNGIFKKRTHTKKVQGKRERVLYSGGEVRLLKKKVFHEGGHLLVKGLRGRRNFDGEKWERTVIYAANGFVKGRGPFNVVGGRGNSGQGMSPERNFVGILLKGVQPKRGKPKKVIGHSRKEKSI